MNSPYARESFATDWWAGKTVEGLTESVPYLTRLKAKFSVTPQKLSCGLKQTMEMLKTIAAIGWTLFIISPWIWKIVFSD